MFTHLLPDDKKTEFLKLARLFLIFENQLLWDGKTEEELTGETNLSNISIRISESQEKSWGPLAQLFRGDVGRNSLSSSFARAGQLLRDTEWEGIDDLLVEKIKRLRLTRQSDPEERLKIALEILRDPMAMRSCRSKGGLLGFPFSVANSSTTHEEDGAKKKRDLPRIMLFELMRFSLENGGISESQKQLLLSFCQQHDIEEDYFKDFLKQAQIIHQETQKTINLFLE